MLSVGPNGAKRVDRASEVVRFGCSDNVYLTRTVVSFESAMHIQDI